MSRLFMDEYMELSPNESKRNEYSVGEYFLRRGWSVERIDEDDLKRPDLLISSEIQVLCEVKTISSVHRGATSEDTFNKDFCTPIKEYLRQRRFRKIRYQISIHNPTMTTFPKHTTNSIAQWIGDSLTQINNGELPVNYKRFDFPDSDYHLFVSSYDIQRDDGYRLPLEVRISPANVYLPPGVDIPVYGGINHRPIEERIDYAVKQLDAEASYRCKEDLPRIVALFFTESIAFNWSETVAVIQKMLYKHKQLSAIVIHKWIPEQEGNIFSPQFLGFHVFHNPILESTLPLPHKVFNDGSTLQRSDLEELIRLLKAVGL